ncbi:MAG: tripartite tricarboxylate transporter substrate binding protein [Acetobacteraceae bacterium]|nr:tripartite tricarboxylate transporter substrate binding protein [Acetobacteraceae bacterium]
MAGETVPPRATRRGIMAGAAGLLAVRHAWAQGGEPWRILVNFPPGGLLDGTARLIAERSQREGRVPTVVENRPGAGGNIGAAAAARAKPDGRTVLASIDTPFTVNPHLYRDMGFDAAKDLVPVALLTSFPLVLLVHPSTGLRDFAGLLAAARKDTLFYTSAGIGSPGHLAMEYLRQQAGLPKGSLENVPQRGNTEALTALLGGTVQAGFLAIGGGPDLVRTGRLHAIAVSGPHRYPALPEVPTVAESGYPGFDVRIASILMAPRGTPGEAIREWNALARGVLEDPASTPRFANWGVQPEDGTAAGAEAWIRAGRERWGQVVLAAGIEAQ